MGEILTYKVTFVTYIVVTNFFFITHFCILADLADAQLKNV